MKPAFFAAFLLASLLASPLASGAPAAEQVVPLWSGNAPGSESWNWKEIEYKNPNGETYVRNVVHPGFKVFLPDHSTANGAGIIVAPGGGFRFLSWDNEGTKVAQWLNAHGIAAFVLKYRLNRTPDDPEEFQRLNAAMSGRGRGRGTPPNSSGEPVQDVRTRAVDDGKQAVRLVRQRAAEWGVAPDRIGLMGFSAGAILTTGVLTSYDAASRPDFAASIYGRSVDAGNIPSDAPPLFIACAEDDATLPATGSADLFAAWKNRGRIAELHIYSRGGHGFGMHQRGLPVDHWIERYGEWLDSEGFTKAR